MALQNSISQSPQGSGLLSIESLIQDFKFGGRLLRKSPGFAIVAILTLAVGIGANTAIFSVVDTILLQPLPYLHPERLVAISESLPNLGGEEVGMAAGEYVDYRDRNRSFEKVAAYQNDGFNLTGAGRPLRVNADRASAELFPVLGVTPILGRTFSDEESRPGADNVVVLSHDLWQRQYGSDPGILGRTLKLDEKSYTVIGVMPASFRFPSDSVPQSERVQLWVPLAFSQDQLGDRLREFGIYFIGRLRPGVTVTKAAQDAESIANAFMQEHGDVYSGNLRVVPHSYLYAAYAVATARSLVILLMAAVACVLLIVCANIANLLLARASHRTREMAIRAAVGADRRRLIRQCLVESALLSLLGGFSGVALAWALVALLRHFGPANLARLQDVRLHPIALAFTLVVSLATSVIFGFFPAWRMSQISPQSCMKESSSGPARATHRLQMRLVTIEIAATLVLVIGSSLMVKSFARVLNVPFGFNPDGVVIVRTLFDRPRYPEPAKREAVQRELLDNLARLPGVRSVAAASHLPLSDIRQIGFRLENAASGDFHWAENSLVSPGYFRAMGITVLRGRDFNYGDGPNTPPAALVNEAFASKFLPGKDPIGQRFHWGDRNLFTIVGVVNDVHISALDADPPPMIYDSIFQVQSGASSRTAFIIRLSHGGREAAQGIFNAVQQQIWAADKDLPAYDTTTLETLVSESVSQRRFTTLLMGAFAATALLLAAIGLFGVISYLVSERRRELAVRMALGAKRGNIAWMILREGAVLTLTGCMAGLAAFAIGSKLLQSSLYQVSVFDPLTMALAPSTLILVALLACYGPARRAMLSDPMVALRYE